jgi:hypothetical protein
MRDGLHHAHSSYLKNVSAIKNGASHRTGNFENQGGFTMRLWVWYCEGHGWTAIFYLIYKFTKSVVGWVIGRSACVFYGRTGPAYNWPPASIFYGRTGPDKWTDGWTDTRTGFLQERGEVGASPSSGFLFCTWVPNRSLGLSLRASVRLWPLDAKKSDGKTGCGRKVTVDAEKSDGKKIRQS